jgi:hypothetical protein
VRAPGVIAAVGVGLVAAVGCRGDRIGVIGAPVTAICEAKVRTGRRTITVDVERDYLPRVIQCENGPADLEALKALAVAARSYLYYTLDRHGVIGDGTADQVFGCGREPEARHHAAVAATVGEVLQYEGRQVAGFYVAGALPDHDCRGGPVDPTRTEAYVTYNEGRLGPDVVQTQLGFRHRDHHPNRGALSQNGSRCLGDGGYDYRSILRYYYGEDIAIAQALGACVDIGPSRDGRLPRGTLTLLAAAACAIALWWLRRTPSKRPRSGRRRRP